MEFVNEIFLLNDSFHVEDHAQINVKLVTGEHKIGINDSLSWCKQHFDQLFGFGRVFFRILLEPFPRSFLVRFRSDDPRCT